PGEGDGYRIAVGRRHVGEPLHIAAHEVVVRLHQQDIDPLLLHRRAHGGPTPLELGRRDGGVDAFAGTAHVVLLEWQTDDASRRGLVNLPTDLLPPRSWLKSGKMLAG